MSQPDLSNLHGSDLDRYLEGFRFYRLRFESDEVLRHRFVMTRVKGG